MRKAALGLLALLLLTEASQADTIKSVREMTGTTNTATTEEMAPPPRPHITVVDVPVETISEERVIELATEALGDHPEPIVIVFKEILEEDSPYMSGVFRQKTNTIELRSTLSAKGIQNTLVHEVAHVLTLGADPEGHHGPTWCATHVGLAKELLPEYADQQERFVQKWYDCPPPSDR